VLAVDNEIAAKFGELRQYGQPAIHPSRRSRRRKTQSRLSNLSDLLLQRTTREDCA